MGEEGHEDTYLPAKYRYWIYLVLSGYYENLSSTRDLIALIDNFQTRLQGYALVSSPKNGAYSKTQSEVERALWSSASWVGINTAANPYLLFLDKPLEEFHSNQDDFFVLKFPANIIQVNEYVRILDQIATEIIHEKSAFAWRNASARVNGDKFLQKIWNAIDAKPGVLGFSLDLKKLVPGG